MGTNRTRAKVAQVTMQVWHARPAVGACSRPKAQVLPSIAEQRAPAAILVRDLVTLGNFIGLGEFVDLPLAVKPIAGWLQPQRVGRLQDFSVEEGGSMARVNGAEPPFLRQLEVCRSSPATASFGLGNLTPCSRNRKTAAYIFWMKTPYRGDHRATTKSGRCLGRACSRVSLACQLDLSARGAA